MMVIALTDIDVILKNGKRVLTNIENVLERVNKDGYAVIPDGKIAREISKKPVIRDGEYFFANNRKKKESILYRSPLKF